MRKAECGALGRVGFNDVDVVLPPRRLCRIRPADHELRSATLISIVQKDQIGVLTKLARIGVGHELTVDDAAARP